MYSKTTATAFSRLLKYWQHCRFFGCTDTKNLRNDQAYATEAINKKDVWQKAFADEKCSVIHLWCHLTNWFRQLGVLSLWSQDRCVLSLSDAITVQQWLSFICHDGHALHLSGYVAISFFTKNLANYFEVHSAVSLLIGSCSKILTMSQQCHNSLWISDNHNSCFRLTLQPSGIKTSLGTVATYLRCEGIINNHFHTNILISLSVKIG